MEVSNNNNDDDTILVISHIREVSVIVSRLEEVTDRHDVLILRRLVLDDRLILESLTKALTTTSKTCCWKRVQLQNIHGNVKSVLHLLCAVVISKYQCIRELQLALPNQEFDSDDWDTICRSIITSTNPTKTGCELQIDGHRDDDNDDDDKNNNNNVHVASSANPLTCLRLTTNLTVSGIQILSRGLSCLTTVCTLQTLDLSNCAMDKKDGDTIIRLLSDGLRENKSLNTFIARNCGLSDCQMGTVIRSFRGSHTTTSPASSLLTNLDLDSNRGGYLTSHALAYLLSDPTSSLQTLILSHQRPFHGYRRRSDDDESDEDRQCRLDVPVMARALWEHNRTLKVLDMSDCFLDDADLDSIVDVLVGGEGKNKITNFGGSVGTPNELEQVIVPRNQITDEGLKRLATKLPLIHGLKRISLWANPFDEEGAQALCCGLQRNMDLVEVDLFRNFSCTETIQYYTLLNRAGRRLLDESTTTTTTDIAFGGGEVAIVDAYGGGGDSSPYWEEAAHTSDPASTRRKPVPLGLWPIVLERLQKLQLPPESGSDGRQEWDRVPSTISETTPYAQATGLRHADLIYYMIRGPALLNS